MKKSHTFLTRVVRIMRNMKDSGIEWIGHFPTSWGKSKLLYYLKTHITDGPHETPTIIDDGIPFISVDNLNDSKHIDFNNVKKYISEDDYRKYMLKAKIENGSILFSKAASIGKTAIVGNEKFMIWSPLAIIKPNNNILNRNYLYYLLNCDQLIKTIQLSGSYNTQANVGMREIERAIIPIPTISNQQQIADFLDRKCSEIDALRLEIEKEIATLKEYKKSIITEAVTKGLNKNVPMKDSNIKWIDSIPNLWQVIRLKYAYWLKGRIGWQGLRADEFVENENCPYLITGTDFDEGHIDWSGCVHITEERFSQDSFIHVKENDLLITKDGTIGKVAIAKKCPEKVSLNTGVLIMRNTRNYKCINKYIYYIISSNQFFDWYKLNHSGNSTIKHLNQEKFYNFQFTLPRYTEQKQIADYLDRKCSKINDIIKAKNKQLSTLDEYKKSLIYEYVTGKKEVPSV